MAPELRSFVAALLHANGLCAEHADAVAQVLVWADLRGTASHGVSRLPQYLGWLRSGEMNGQAQIRPSLQLPALSVLEGDRCAGAAGMQMAVRMAMEGARHAGMAVCLLRATTHTGALGCYTQAIAEAGMLGIACAASGPLMAYHGAAAAGVSTAPLSIAAPGPGGQPPLVFDMASSAVAFGRLQQAKARGESIPPGWALDADGRPTTDPQAAVLPLPLGGAKGAGLALMMEVLCSLLTNNPLLAPALAMPPSQRRHAQNAVVMAMNLDALVQTESYGRQMADLMATLRALPAREEEAIRMPGERGAQEARLRGRQGIVVPPRLAQVLEAAAAQAGVAAPWVGTASS
jgi:LDH2 family malate/lactate/ureidoglycolate dehydrogenase